MGYVLDDGWDNCTPVARAGNAAFGVYARCGIWVARNLTDGFIPGEIATAYGSPELARKLVDVGLWEAVEGGYLAVDYLTLNPTAEKVRERRKAEAERKARWRENAKKAQARAGKPGPRGTRRGTPKGQDAGQDAGLTGSLSSSSNEEERGARPLSQGAARAPEPAHPPSEPDEVHNPDWRRGKAFGVEPDPVEAARARQGAAAARASVPKRARPDERGPSALARLSEAVAHLPPLVEPPADPPEEPLAEVIPIRPSTSEEPA